MGIETELKFAKSKVSRDMECINKDKIIRPLFESIKITNPENFTAMVMPCLYGAEVYILNSKGVPNSNIFAVEQEKVFHKEIKNCTRSDRTVLKGLNTTPIPLKASQAFNMAYRVYRVFNVIYFDYLGQPDYEEHYQDTINKIFKLKAIKKGGMLILTFGKTRCSHETSVLNKKLISHSQSIGWNGDFVPTQIYIGAAAKESRFKYESMDDFEYQSTGGSNKQMHYVTTVVRF